MGNLFENVGVLPNPLNKHDLYELFIQMRNGDSLAKEKIVLHNLRLVIIVLKKYYYSGFPFEELVSVGTIGLMNAINTFDINKNFEFATYAAVCIKNEVLMYIRKNNWNLKVVGFDAVLKSFVDGSNVTYANVLASDEDIVSNYEEVNIYQVVLGIINDLPERERMCVMLYYGLGGYERIEQKDIGIILNIGQPTVSRILKKAIAKIRSELVKYEVLEKKNLVKGA